MTVPDSSSQNTPDAFSVHTTSILENLLAPGGRLRLSPFVQETQLSVLFGEPPDPFRRASSCRDLVRRHDGLIRERAKLFAEFTSQREFGSNYSNQAFLDAYLIHYFTVNVGKVQLSLLDLVRHGLLHGDLRLLDVGVTSAATTVALLDFILAWKVACDLTNATFPISAVTLGGVDQCQASIDHAQGVVRAYGSCLKVAVERQPDPLTEILIEAAHNHNWQLADLNNQQNFELGGTTLLVASNVLNELNYDGKRVLGQAIGSLHEGSLAVIIEPGDKIRATQLMAWRRNQSTLYPFRQLGPCGQELVASLPPACDKCWSARRENLLETELYSVFRMAALEAGADIQDSRIENQLLSWSYVWLERGERAAVSSEEQSLAIQSGDSWPEEIPLRYIGSFTSATEAADPHPDALDGSLEWKKYVKFCPQRWSEKGICLVQRPGTILPKLRFGDLVRVRRSSLGFLREAGPLELITSSETELVSFSPDRKSTGFLDGYSASTRMSVDAAGLRLFGFSSMHAFQHSILERVLTGRSILAIAATGSGKSECFILPAVLLPGITVVISPLKSLMVDQYEQRIRQRFGLDHLCTYINGDIPFSERQARLKRLELGHYKLIYLTPEQLERDHILSSLQAADRHVGVRYLAMDEAHCISQWGHDFRPCYLNIIRRLNAYSLNPTRIALTATASPLVRTDICEELVLDPASIDEGGDLLIVTSNRPELNLVARVLPSTDEKAEHIVNELAGLLRENHGDLDPGAAIVFMPHTGQAFSNFSDKTGGSIENPEHPLSGEEGSSAQTGSNYPASSPVQRTAQARSTINPNSQRGKLSAGVMPFAAYLEHSLRRRVAIYHSKMELGEEGEEPKDLRSSGQASKLEDLADMSQRTRSVEQRRFIQDETPIMVATKGFGMGIDKPNIRLVLHRTPPANLESYAQEAGRAGRDGLPARAILFYSPDSPDNPNESSHLTVLPSDHSIQNFFVSQNHIRRADLEAMVAFLRTRTFGSGPLPGTAYFTNDEAIAFFDDLAMYSETSRRSAAFTWPAFPERMRYRKESALHKAVLDRGKLYIEKTNYIDRILQVMHKIRPTIAGHPPRMALLDAVHSVGGRIIEPRVIDPQAIVNSNAYFGEIFRRSKMTASLLVELIESCDLSSLAKHLGCSLRETSDLLYDVRRASGRLLGNGQWRPELLNFMRLVAPRRGPASGLTTLETWRAYAGSFKRVSLTEAEKRAKKAGRLLKPRTQGGTYQETTLDDWFSWKECCSPKGWEIRFGPAFLEESYQDMYLNAFMDIHDRRKQNDWDAYHRMLTDYVGVSRTGEMLPSSGKRQSCLRSVLLGYLRTHEVVVGENCFGCSRCVPDENFGLYAMEDRKRVVVRLGERAIRMFEALEAQANVLPGMDDTVHLLTVVEEEHSQGRSSRDYLRGWSASLLDQQPDHCAALWLRLAAMANEIIVRTDEEVLALASHLEKILDKNGLRQLDELLDRFQALDIMSSEFLKLRVRIHRALIAYQSEQQALEELIARLTSSGQLTDHTADIHRAAGALILLQSPDGPLPDSIKLEKNLHLTARYAPDYASSLAAYRPLVSAWAQDQLLRELDEQKTTGVASPHIEAALWIAWLKQHGISDQIGLLEGYLENNLGDLAGWPIEAATDVIQFLPLGIILGAQEAIGLALSLPLPPAILVRIAINAMDQGYSPSRTEQITITSAFFTDHEPQGNSEGAPSLLDHMAVLLEVDEWTALNTSWRFNHWLDLLAVDPNRYRQIDIAVFLRGIELYLASAFDDGVFTHLVSLLFHLASEEATAHAAIESWIELSIQDVGALNHLLSKYHDHPALGINWHDRLLDRLLEEGDPALLVELGKSLPSARWRRARLFAQAIDNYNVALAREKTVTSEVLFALSNALDTRKDPEQADMLIVALEFITITTNPNWRTPHALRFTTMVHAGREEMALEVANKFPDIAPKHKGRSMSVPEYITAAAQPPRPYMISPDYARICHSLLQR